MSRHSALFSRLLGLLLTATAAGCADHSNDALFSKLSARAEAGSAAAQYNLGMLYNNGIGTAQNPSLAFQWFERAAKGGDPLGSYKVGCYYAGQFQSVVPRDSEKALTYKLAAARAGYALAQHDVAIAYAERNDLKEAVEWWHMAAEQGDISALMTLANGFMQGKGVPANPAKSYEYLLRARQLIPTNQAEWVKHRINQQRKDLDADAATQAEKAAETWRPQPSLLTVRAREGIEEARRLAQ